MQLPATLLSSLLVLFSLFPLPLSLSLSSFSSLLSFLSLSSLSTLSSISPLSLAPSLFSLISLYFSYAVCLYSLSSLLVFRRQIHKPETQAQPCTSWELQTGPFPGACFLFCEQMALSIGSTRGDDETVECVSRATVMQDTEPACHTAGAGPVPAALTVGWLQITYIHLGSLCI